MPSRSTIAITVGAAVVGSLAYARLSSKTPFGIVGPLSLTSLKLESSVQLNHNTKKLRFALPDPSTTSGLAVTTALLSISRPPANGQRTPVFRPYTPTSDPQAHGYLEFMIKQYPNGEQSTFMHSLKPGDSVTFMRTPLGVSWKPNQHPHVALIAGGAGITPMYSLLNGILSNPEDKTRVTLVWGVNTDADIFLKDEFAELEKKHPGRFTTHYVVSHPEDGSPYPKGYVTKELLEKAGLSAGGENVKVMLSGPPTMEKALVAKGSGVLAQLGYKPSQIHRF
ncbi:FAD-binding FR-type domain-containing protein [Mycena chlorophos]|uniref:FAD-binding FR-type domain-containing protein n=1 Tax=Mycena chlorophos TaxID=658473 RepID=A0A8H6S6Y9_MYCCL|nr:FAD-binding FR-type domain-containing protein [Mycena chlorophos]